jgi:metallo-beta-lactamase class B
MKVELGFRLRLWPLLLLAAPPVHAAVDPDWTTPLAPFHIVGNLYYVGSKDLASYLIVTSAGDILINSNLEVSVPQIRHSVEQLGQRFTDIRVLLISHSHWDHDSGSAEIKRATGALYMVMDGDVPVVESGGEKDFQYPTTRYPPAKVNRVLHDGDQVRLGGTVLTAHKTPGHTRGCTTWTLQIPDHGRTLNVVIVGSWNVNPGYRLVNQPGQPASYPGIAADFEHTFSVLEHLPCDVFLGAHGAYFGMLDKLARRTSDTADVWIDPQGYLDKVHEREQAFRTELARQSHADDTTAALSDDTPAQLTRALSAAPATIAAGAAVLLTGYDGKTRELRPGTNGWTCTVTQAAATANPDAIEHHPACFDRYGLEWMRAYEAGRDPDPNHVGYSYMLQGGSSWSNTDPTAYGLAQGQKDSIHIPPHIMILNARLADTSGFPSKETNPDTSRPFVMFGGTRYALLILPVK